ncbi:ribosomal protein MRP49 [Purpureocillium lavendulum]|uniref:Ribosomal protein MRP49 n=1 Tax=Purpureocillium lavendulum TaxID=1247861 RepID=A0AB34FRN5_9HYPO|nr:ribosomal protein MRP49 [Purpureocillium lavendulum]
MRSLGERLNLLRKLINLKCGPGAAILPPEVTRIHMDFATKINGGHMGARKFWREYLPRLKYHNPAIPMIVNRHDQSSSAPTMTIYLRNNNSVPSTDSAAAETHTQPSSSRNNLSKAQAPGSDERIVNIDMKDKHSSDILEFFIAETRAKALQPTNEEIAEMQALESLKKDAAVDRERVRQLRAEKKKEEDMLKRARAAGGMAEQEAA